MSMDGPGLPFPHPESEGAGDGPPPGATERRLHERPNAGARGYALALTPAYSTKAP
jgi:hypothetical protein